VTRDEILRTLQELKPILIEKFGVKKIGLFGSYATNEQTESSDIDLIVDMPSEFDRYYDLKDLLQQRLQKEIDLGLEKSIRRFIKNKIQNEIIYV